MQMIGDPLAKAIVAKVPSQFLIPRAGMGRARKRLVTRAIAPITNAPTQSFDARAQEHLKSLKDE